MAKKITADEIVIKYEDYMHHFIEDSGYPVIINKELAKTITKHLPALMLNSKKDRVFLKTKAKFDDAILAAYYRRQYEEMKELHYEMYDKVQALARELI